MGPRSRSGNEASGAPRLICGSRGDRSRRSLATMDDQAKRWAWATSRVGVMAPDAVPRTRDQRSKLPSIDSLVHAKTLAWKPRCTYVRPMVGKAGKSGRRPGPNPKRHPLRTRVDGQLYEVFTKMLHDEVALLPRGTGCTEAKFLRMLIIEGAARRGLPVPLEARSPGAGTVAKATHAESPIVQGETREPIPRHGSPTIHSTVGVAPKRTKYARTAK